MLLSDNIAGVLFIFVMFCLFVAVAIGAAMGVYAAKQLKKAEAERAE